MSLINTSYQFYMTNDKCLMQSRPCKQEKTAKDCHYLFLFVFFFKETRYKISDNNHQIALGGGDRGRDAWLFNLYRAINPNQHYYFNILLLFLMLLLSPHLFLNSTSPPPPSKKVPPAAMTNVVNTSTISTVVTTVVSVN